LKIILLLLLPPWHNSSTQARPTSSLRFLDHTQWHTPVGRAPVDKGSAHCRDLYLTTQHTKERDTHAPCGIQTRNPSKQSAADPTKSQQVMLIALSTTLVLCTMSVPLQEKQWIRLFMFKFWSMWEMPFSGLSWKNEEKIGYGTMTVQLVTPHRAAVLDKEPNSNHPSSTTFSRSHFTWPLVPP
jgi:hypothetical protein